MDPVTSVGGGPLGVVELLPQPSLIVMAQPASSASAASSVNSRRVSNEPGSNGSTRSDIESSLSGVVTQSLLDARMTDDGVTASRTRFRAKSTLAPVQTGMFISQFVRVQPCIRRTYRFLTRTAAEIRETGSREVELGAVESVSAKT